jgi:hypothetical protein
LPKLGAYIAVPLSYNSYLSENIFDVALEGEKKANSELEEFKRAHE